MPSSSPLKLFSPGLSLICMGIYEINKEMAPGETSLAEAVDYPVPHSTKAVHVAVIKEKIEFGTDDKPKPSPFTAFTWEITNPDDSKLANGSFKFNFNAWLQSEKFDDQWVGYFLLEILCFG